MTSADRVRGLLLLRIWNDVRAIEKLSLNGYVAQATTLASSIFETAYTVLYIADSDTTAGEWSKLVTMGIRK